MTGTTTSGKCFILFFFMIFNNNLLAGAFVVPSTRPSASGTLKSPSNARA